MIVEFAPVGALGFDTDAKLSAAQAASLAGRGFKFGVRYLSLGATAPGDLDASEVRAILSAGLALMAVQHVRLAGWTPSEPLGLSDGSHAVSNAIGAGLPKGVTIYTDLEGVAAGTTSADVITYTNAVSKTIREAGYDAGVYVGAGLPLTSDELYHALLADTYWKSASEVPAVRSRGYAMLQLFDTQVVEGVPLDVDVVQRDYLGGTPRWLRGTPSGLLALDLRRDTLKPT